MAARVRTGETGGGGQRQRRGVAGEELARGNDELRSRGPLDRFHRRSIQRAAPPAETNAESLRPSHLGARVARLSRRPQVHRNTVVGRIPPASSACSGPLAPAAWLCLRLLDAATHRICPRENLVPSWACSDCCRTRICSYELLVLCMYQVRTSSRDYLDPRLFPRPLD